MKTVKVTKTMLKMHPADLLVHLNAVNKDKKRAYPEHVYFSKEDYRELKKNLKKCAKKIFPDLSEKMINYSVNMDLLNYGPNETLSDAIRPGHMLMDDEAIEKDK